jgi:hypothetical protein
MFSRALSLVLAGMVIAKPRRERSGPLTSAMLAGMVIAKPGMLPSGTSGDQANVGEQDQVGNGEAKKRSVRNGVAKFLAGCMLVSKEERGLAIPSACVAKSTKGRCKVYANGEAQAGSHQSRIAQTLY